MTDPAKVGVYRSGVMKARQLAGKVLNDKRLTHVMTGAAFTMAAKVAGAGAGFSFNVLVARQIGADDYGLFSYALTLVALLAVISASGLNNVAVQFVAAYVLKQRWKLLSGFLRWTILRVSLVSGVVAAGLILVAEAPFFEIGDDERLSLLIGSGLVVFGALAVVQAGILRGLKRFVAAELVDSGAGLRSLLSLAGMLAVLATGRRLSGADEGMWISTLSALAAVLFSSVVLFRSLPPPLRLRNAEYKGGEWIKTAVPLMLMNAAFLLQSQVDIIMLKHMSTTVDVALFFAAWRIASLVLFPIVSMNAITAPMMVELVTLREHNALQKIIYHTSAITFLCALVLCIAGVLWGRNALSLFGSEFVDGYAVLVILLAGQCINAFAGNLVLLMTVSGHHGAACRIVIVAMLGNITLNFFLIPMMGREGAACSSFIISLATSSIMAWYLFKYTGIRASIGFMVLAKLNDFGHKIFR